MCMEAEEKRMSFEVFAYPCQAAATAAEGEAFGAVDDHFQDAVAAEDEVHQCCHVGSKLKSSSSIPRM